MERIYYNHLPVKSFVIVIFTLFLTILFSSCENFMDSSSVKDEILEQIYINNHECPVAKEVVPAYDNNGVAKDTSIQITFSIPVDPTTFEENYTIEDSKGNNLKKYYKTPKWSSGNRVVTIPVDKTNLIDLGNNKTLDIILAVTTKCKTKDKLPLQQAINHKFKIQNKIDGKDFPEATVDKPLYSLEGVTKDQDIIINFTVPIDIDTFNENYYISDINGNNLTDHYLTPQFRNLTDSDIKMQVTIAANKKNLIDLGNEKTMDIIFSLSTECKTEDNLQIKQEVNHKFRIKDDIESDEFPIATEIEPSFNDNGVPKDKEIKMSFTVPVNPESFAKNYRITDIYGNDLQQYYKAPSWSDNNKNVTISPDKTNLIDLGTNKTLDITFALSTDCKSEDDFSLKQPVNHKFRINNDVSGGEYPVATVEQPRFSEDGVKKNRAIIISFTKPIKIENFEDNFEIRDSAGYDLKQYFMSPQWASMPDGSLQVTIPANELNLIDLRGNKTQDIFISLSKNCRTEDGIPLKEDLNVKYRINDEIDNEAPVIKNTKATLPDSFIPNKVGNGVIEFVEGALTTESEEEICKTNHFNTKFNLYVEGTDYGGGKVSAIISYRKIYEVTGSSVNEEPKTVKLNLLNKNEAGFLCDNYTLDLSDEMYSDGMYEVKIYVQDAYALNSTEYKVYYVIRDTRLAYSANAKVGYYTVTFRDDVSEGYDYESNEDLMTQYNEWNRTVPTVERIEDALSRFTFDNIPKDAYFTSNDTGKTYSDDPVNFTYYLSWGTDMDHMSNQYKFENIYTGNNTCEFPVLTEFNEYRDAHEYNDIILQAAYRDTVGNENDLIVLYPKKVQFYNYVVEDDEENTKKVTLNFEDMSSSNFTRFANIPEREVFAKYRVFYGKVDETKDERITDLKRNTAVPWEQDIWSSISDSHVLRKLESDSEYYVYIQANYETNSLVNGQWNGGFFGALQRVIVNTGISGSSSVEKPEFTFTKKSAGVNTALFNVTATITNPQENIKYVPCYSTDGGENWIYYEANDSEEFTFAVTNPLRAPFGKDEAWGTKTGNHVDAWDENPDTHEDNTYFTAVQICKGRYGYPNVSAKVKVLAVSNNITVESDVQNIEFSEDDDNIPPTIAKDITQHDSRLSYDGHFYQYENIVREAEGHLSEFFQYYYTPYQESWGDSLSVLSPEEIEVLPGGITTYQSSCYKKENGEGADYTIDLKIPIYGLEDGHYMLFGKVTDTYGNYTYLTLGKVHIGSFKEKLKVEYDQEHNKIIATLPIHPDEYFERNMINIQHIWYGHNKYSMEWETKNNELYGYLNELQDCETVYEGGKTQLRYETTNEISNDIIGITWSNDIATVLPKEPDSLTNEYRLEKVEPYQFYKVTMQGFNENPYDEGSRKGVDRKYGRPYSNYNPSNINNTDNEYLYTRRIKGWVDNETEYDLCTEETVSNTVYLYIPPTREQDPGWYQDPVKSSFIVSTATPRSNKDYLVNVIASNRDLGNDITEWEKRGKIIKSHQYNKTIPESYDSEGDPIWDGNYVDNPAFNTFNDSVAAQDMVESHEKGFIYYVVTAHFADNSSAISNVYTMYGF